MDAPIKFRVNCPCGDFVLVSEGAAGATFTCSCGKPIEIPSSTQLLLDAGLAPVAPPEEVVEAMLITGAVPENKACTVCGDDSRRIIHVLTECERLQTQRSG